MDNKNKFLKGYTKNMCVAFSVVTGLLLVTLIMITLLISGTPENKALICFCYTIGLMFLDTLFVGIVQIRVFNDYKSQRKSLCADGIFIICLGILIIIAGLLFAVLQGSQIASNEELSNVDIRYIISVFLFSFAIWKAITVSLSFKEKRKNWWIELISAILWAILGVLTVVTIFISSNTLIVFLWLFVAIGWLMIINYILYLLYSYIFNTPTYLETEEAIGLLNKDILERQNRIERLNAMTGAIGNNMTVKNQVEQSKQVDDDVESKLAKLDSLLNKGIISKEEYDSKRKQIIDNL